MSYSTIWTPTYLKNEIARVSKTYFSDNMSYFWRTAAVMLLERLLLKEREMNQRANADGGEP